MLNIKKTFQDYIKEAVVPPGQVKGLVFYKGAQTVAGGITPTGKGNAITDSMFGLTEDKVYKTAYDHNFRTDNNKVFQEDLYNYLSKNRPDMIKTMWDTYGTTAKGVKLPADQLTLQTFTDGLLGARTMYLVSEFAKAIPPVPYKTEAFNGQNYYGPDNHIIGLGRWQVRKTDAVNQAGNAQGKNVEFMFVVPNTASPDQTKGLYVIPGDKWSNDITGGTNRILRPQLLEPYKQQGVDTQQGAQNQINTNSITPAQQVQPVTPPVVAQTKTI